MTPSRTQTTTPLQALSLLNNMFVLEQADCFAERVTFESGSEPASQVRHAFRLALVREPSWAELEAAVEFVGEHGLGSLCRVLFNSNEFLYVE